MKFLLTSSGIMNSSINAALLDLLGKPIADSNALFIPTATYPFPGGAGMAWRAIHGLAASPLCTLGWKSLGVLELTALPSIAEAAWMPSVEAADALLVWGGDPLYLSYWLRQSGLLACIKSMRRDLVYVGVSAGSMAVSSILAVTYLELPGGAHDKLAAEEIVFATEQGDSVRTLTTARGAGLVDFALIPHFEHADHPDASSANAEKLAARLPVRVYAIDDQTAIKLAAGRVEVVSEGVWKLFTPRIPPVSLEIARGNSV